MKISKRAVSYMLYAAMGMVTAIAGLTIVNPLWWVLAVIFIALEINAERK